MNKTHPSHHTKGSEKRTKANSIRLLKKNYPDLKASEIAKRLQTTESYVHNVLSKAKRMGEIKRRREERLYGAVHGRSFYQDMMWYGWYDELDAPIVNGRTGMKQVGFKENGDPCSCQIHRNGRVVVFPHAPGWREWLKNALTLCGLDIGKSSMLVDNLTIQVILAEGGVKVPDGMLPKDVFVKGAWGMMIVRDDSPTKNRLEIKLCVPDLSRYLGLPEIKMQMDLLTNGTMTTHQLLRVAIALLINAQRRNGSESAEKT